ncbi:MAG: histidine kinase, partial [Cytophagaceae bacterium]|nr:histidine kinase [Gemmatimonadaceae bacterium]
MGAQPTPATRTDVVESPGQEVLDAERDRAERVLNGVRAVVLSALALAAGVYAPSLTPELNRVNLAVLIAMLLWTVGQYPLFYRRTRLPGWLRLANPIVDITGVTALVAGYGIVASPALALKTPILDAYFVILASLPVASSTRKAASVSFLAVAQYGALVSWFAATGRLRMIMDPVVASGATGVSPLDEGAKLLLLTCVGAVATYATRWQERLAGRYATASGQSARLQSRLTRTELQALKLQLQPHFLFNTLNAITALVHRDASRAERMISGLSELLRVSLGSAGDQEVTLARELEVLQHYVDIQQERFEDRLTVTVDAPAEIQRALVPNLILQPLVENAIKHGLSGRAAAGQVTVVARRVDDRLVMTVDVDPALLRTRVPPLLLQPMVENAVVHALSDSD